MKPLASTLLEALKGLNAHGQVWPCSFEMVRVPPCLYALAVPVDDDPPAELAEVPPVPPDLSVVCFVLEHAEAARPIETATASSDDLLRPMPVFLSEGCAGT